MTRKAFRNQVLYITFKYSHSTHAGYIKRRKGHGTRFLGWQWKDKKQKSEQWKRKRNLKQVAEQPTERDTAGQETEWKRQTDRERERGNAFEKWHMQWSAATHILSGTASRSKHTPTTTCQPNTIEYSEPQRERNADWHFSCYTAFKWTALKTTLNSKLPLTIHLTSVMWHTLLFKVWGFIFF